MNNPTIVTLTPRGLALGQRLVEKLGRGEVTAAAGSTRSTLTGLFQAGRPIVCVMALGIVVRILGPLADNKRTDPAVVVVDEAGKFAISVLGGHRGGANVLARQVADALGATAVITTASDAHGLPAVDLIGRSLGWEIEHSAALTAVAAAAVRGGRIAVFQETGAPHWYEEFGDWPATFECVDAWPPAGVWDAALCISDRVRPEATVPAVVYRPKVLVAGIGCRRGVPTGEIDAAFVDAMCRYGYAPRSLARVATVTLKAEEPGLLEFARRRQASFHCFAPDQLSAVPGVLTPSERVRSKIGIAAVAEPAALLAAGATTLLIPKQKSARVTVALARLEERFTPERWRLRSG